MPVLLDDSFRRDRICSCQPVVPITRFTPSAAIRSMLLDTARRRGKIDRHIDAAKILGRDAFEVRVVEFIELQRDLDATRGAMRSIIRPILP